MAHSNTCPAVSGKFSLTQFVWLIYLFLSVCWQCRNKVERISKNHIVNNLVEAYLRAHPERKRAAEDLKELDDKNKITRDMVSTQCYHKIIH